MKVLIVEDNTDSRNLLVKQLSAYGHKVTAAVDGVDALEKALQSPPDILVSDILMPRMDGYKLCYEWKQHKQLKEIPFVFYTAIYTSGEDEKFALKLGANLFIRKPIEPEALAKILSQAFEQAKEGLLPPAKAPPKPSLYLTEYNERLVAKLNEKVAELEKSEEEIRYISSILGAIRNINQLIVRERDRTKLLKGACQILHNVREYRFIWVGLIEAGHKRVIPVARAGVEDKYLDEAEITWDDSQSGQSPAGVAIKTKKPDLIRNILEDPRSEAWREKARQQDYRSSAAIPIIHNEKVYGALSVYSSNPDGFNEAEVGLLEEVSSDLAFALNAIERQEARQQAEEALLESEEKYKTLTEDVPIGIYFNDFRGTFLYGNKKAAEITGYKREELLGKSFLKLKLLGAKELGRAAKLLALNKLGKATGPDRFVLNRKDGTKSFVEIRTRITTVGGKKLVLGMVEDITERKQAEEALRDSEEKFKGLAESITDIFFAFDKDLRYIYWNKASEELTGVSAKDALGKHLRDIFPESVGAKNAEKMYRKALKTQKVQSFVNEYQLGDKSHFFEINAYPSKDGLSVFVKDVTERKQAEDALQQSNKRFNDIVENSLEWIWEVDASGKYTYASPVVEQILGYKPEEVIGKHFYDLFHPDDREELKKAAFAAFAEKQSFRQFVNRNIRKDGEIVWISTSGVPILDGEGNLLGYRGADIDITERMRAEEALRENEAFQSGLLANSPTPINVVNPDGSLRYVNPAMERLTGFSAKELIGQKPPFPYWPEEGQDEFMKGFERAMRRGGKGVVKHYRKKNGERFWVEITSTRVKTDGKFQYLLVNWVDITERRQAEEALRESEAFSSSLLSNSPIPMLVINPDTSLRYVNQALKELTGFSAAEVIGRKAPYPWWTEETLQKTKGDLAGAMSKGAVRLEELFKKKNGERFWVEITSTSVRQDGEFKYYLANWVDITERKQAEEEVVRLARFPSENPTPVMRVDQDGAVLYANKAALPLLNEWKCQVGQLLPKYWREFTLNVLNSGSRKDVEVNVGKRVFTVTFSPVTGEGYVNLYGLDITERKQAEEALRESEARYRAVIEGAHDMIQSVGLDGGIIFVNKAWRDTLGYTEAELSGLNLFDIIHSDSQAHCREMMAEVAKGKPARNIEATFLTKDGRMILVEGSAAPRYISNKVVASQGIFRDVTERKRAEAALADEATRHRILIDESSDGIVILDEDGKVYEANRRFAEMLGYTPEEARELSVWDWEFQFPREQVAEMIRTVDETGDHFETRHRRKDGSTFDVEISTNGAVYAGQKLIFCVCRDITARKQAEAALRESEEKYKNLVGATSDIIWETDAEARFTFISPKVKDILGYRVDEVVGKKRTLDLVPKGQFRKWLKRFKELNAKKEPFFGLEIPHLHKNGRQVIFETSGIPLFDGEGKLKGYVGINRDITERRQMQEQLVITDRLASVGELAAGIAHELNNPLTGVIGFSQLLMDKEMPEDIKQDIKVVYGEARRASQVVKNLLTFARKHAAAKEKVNINDIIKKVLELRAYEQNLENIKVDARLAPGLPDIMVDYFQLQQVFLNIIINAEYFMKEAHHKGELTITTERVDNKVRVSFADDGPGIAKENLGHLFDPFFTTKEVGKGTGLGLSICHGIVAEHGGRIYVESEPGKGATFIVELPIGTAERKGGAA
jgi:PAS domain S-box-containing protein